MREWNLTLVLHWPHDRCLVGWEYIGPDEEFDYTTIKLFLLVTTFELNIKSKKLEIMPGMKRMMGPMRPMDPMMRMGKKGLETYRKKGEKNKGALKNNEKAYSNGCYTCS